MNAPVLRLYVLVIVLFAVLVVFTSWWSVFDAEALKDKQANKRPLLEQQQIQRGRILAADGTVLARSVATGRGDALRYVRRYPEGALYGHPIGYSFIREGDSELEKYHDDELVGEGSEFASILDELRGLRQEGNDVVTNIDRRAVESVARSGTMSVSAGGYTVGRLVATYADIQPGEICALFGSTDHLELAANSESAADRLQLGRGAAVEVKRTA